MKKVEFIEKHGEEVCKEIKFGSWNFREEFYNSIEC